MSAEGEAKLESGGDPCTAGTEPGGVRRGGGMTPNGLTRGFKSGNVSERC
jgi:hypothetical protein